MAMVERRAELTERFRQQQRFADGYSPLYAQLFGIVAGWLAGTWPDPVVAWLLDAAATTAVGIWPGCTPTVRPWNGRRNSIPSYA